ncbi:uncharacterized protein At4g15545-like isoform X2 [Punica granatum]|uniref:Uncharacterized protein At4g15545-like isoform X2 n=1 Tax=Punica granatum TaxID=22663 RepID=A0A6P8DU90_PUNGR|nr:uncharacterized protein At4g15545-like isoform X2 [Punica granatum]
MPSGTSDLGIPEDILKLLPSDPYDQLDVACKITSIALSTRVSELESQSSALRAELAQRDALIADLRSRLDSSETEKERLVKENESLSHTVQKLSRHVEKLEFLKKTLVQSLQEDKQTSALRTEFYSQERAPPIIAKPTPIDDGSLPPSRSSSIQSELSEMENPSVGVRDTEVPTQSLHVLLSERSSPELTPLDSPPSLSGSVSPSRSSKLVYSRRHTMSLSSAGSAFDDRSSMHSLSSMETRSQTGRSLVDAREFLRKVRTRLSHEQFGEFLESVKDFNSHRQNREETLRRAAEIFGTDNSDLYDTFQGLLAHNTHRSR